MWQRSAKLILYATSGGYAHEQPSAVNFQKIFVCHLIGTNPIGVVNLKPGLMFRQALLERPIEKIKTYILWFRTFGGSRVQIQVIQL